MTTMWINGELVEESQARVNALDHGFTVGDGVFETIKVVSGRPFALTRHLTRLNSSAIGLGLGEIDRSRIENAVEEILDDNQHAAIGRMRITLTSGTGPLGSGRGHSQHTLVVAVSAAAQWPAECGILLVPWTRNERSALNGIKSTSYAENAKALHHAHQHDMAEAIFFDTHERLSEGTGTNIFAVIDGQVCTPSVDCGLLQGITRELVIQWCDAAGISVMQKHINAQELDSAEEVFLVSTTRDVQPVTIAKHMDNQLHIVSSRVYKQGPVTKKIAHLFQAQASNNIDP